MSRSSTGIAAGSIVTRRVCPVVVPPAEESTVYYAFFSVEEVGPIRVDSPVGTTEVDMCRRGLPVCFGCAVVMDTAAVFTPRRVPEAGNPTVKLRGGIYDGGPRESGTPPDDTTVEVLKEQVFRVVLRSITTPSFEGEVHEVFNAKV